MQPPIYQLLLCYLIGSYILVPHFRKTVNHAVVSLVRLLLQIKPPKAQRQWQDVTYENNIKVVVKKRQKQALAPKTTILAGIGTPVSAGDKKGIMVDEEVFNTWLKNNPALKIVDRKPSN